MKKLTITLLVMTFVNTNMKAQQETSFYPYAKDSKTASINPVRYSSPGTDKDYNFYMKRSRNQRIVGWSTLGTGLLFSGIGILVANSSNDNYYDDGDENTAGILLLLGAVSGIVSIPFMISATVNKHKAKLILDNQKTAFGVPSHVGKNIPGFTLVMPIGK